MLNRPGQIASYERELYAVGAEIIAKNQSRYAGLTGQITWMRFSPSGHLGLYVESGSLSYRSFERLMRQCNVDAYPQNAEQVASELLDESNTTRRYVVPGTLAYASAAMRYEAHEADAEYGGMTAETLLHVLDDIRSREAECEMDGRWTASDEMYLYRETRHGLRM